MPPTEQRKDVIRTRLGLACSGFEATQGTDEDATAAALHPLIVPLIDDMEAQLVRTNLDRFLPPEAVAIMRRLKIEQAVPAGTSAERFFDGVRLIQGQDVVATVPWSELIEPMTSGSTVSFADVITAALSGP